MYTVTYEDHPERAIHTVISSADRPADAWHEVKGNRPNRLIRSVEPVDHLARAIEGVKKGIQTL